MTMLKDVYHKQVKRALQEVFHYTNPMEVPRLVKIVISMGLGEASKDKQILDYCLSDLKKLSGQKAILTRSVKAISNFKLRKGQAIGAKVTLRDRKMFDFMFRFVHICAPKISDFRGFKRKGDGRGSFSLGLKDQTIFPEVDLDHMKRSQGMNITFVTSAKTDPECLELLKRMGLPLKET